MWEGKKEDMEIVGTSELGQPYLFLLSINHPNGLALLPREHRSYYLPNSMRELMQCLYKL